MRGCNMETGNLAQILKEAIESLGQQNEEGDVRLWRNIVNEDISIYIVSKKVLKAAGLKEHFDVRSKDD